MRERIIQLIQESHLLSHTTQGIQVVVASEPSIVTTFVTDLLTVLVDRKTVLYLSGGKTPKKVYETFAKEEQLMAGAIGMVDERYGKKFHENSNEAMIRATGLIRYCEIRGIPFYPILRDGLSRVETAEAYDEQVRTHNALFQKSVALLGIGADGHTAGIPAFREIKLSSGEEKLYETYDLVTQYHDTKGMYNERVTMTFTALSLMDLLVVSVFGDDKKEALEQLFTAGDEKEIPARFYTRPEIAQKTLLITDQMI